MTKKLRTKGEWDHELLMEYYAEIEIIAKNELQLDTYPNQLEIISSEQMMEAYSTHAMPIMYDHWRFGKSYLDTKRAYSKGHMNLAYEVVINSNPCIAYLMEENSIMMQALVTAHAAFGHNAVFKNNYMFKEWTDASAIVDYLIFAKKYIALCEEKYGHDEVEMFLDACHSLELYGVDKYKRVRKSISKETEALKNKIFEEENYDDVLHTTASAPKNSKIVLDDSIFSKFENMEPEENIMYFLEKKAPLIDTWQREVLRIVRKISQYFYPQRMTSLIHEGFATATHYYIMNRLYDKGLVDEGFMMEFLESHTGVTRQLDFDHPAYSRTGINVYALGFAMFEDIKRICMEPTDEDREWFPDFAGNGKWVETRNWAMQNFRDESFILQFLSPKVIRDFKMFAFQDDGGNSVVITDIHNAAGYRNIRERLSSMFNLTEILPNIQITRVDTETRQLILTHFAVDKLLDVDATQAVLEYIRDIWKFEVTILSINEKNEILDEISSY